MSATGPSISKVELERFKFTAVKHIDPRRLPRENLSLDVNYSRFIEREVDELVMHLEAHVFGERLDTIDIAYPADWWQAFKDRWFPTWAKVRWPVRSKRLRYEVRAYYPQVSIPQKEHLVRFVPTGKEEC